MKTEEQTLSMVTDKAITNRPGKPVVLDIAFDPAVIAVVRALKAESFTIVSSLDIKKVMKEKFDADIKRFITIGVYNADVLKRVVTEKPEAALWLPWSIIVESDGERTQVTLPDPLSMTMFVPEDATWRDIAENLKLRFDKVVTALMTTGTTVTS